MTKVEAFQVETVLSIIERKLQEDWRSCEYDFYLKLKEELTDKLEVYYEENKDR